jgi:hypothetical protein
MCQTTRIPWRPAIVRQPNRFLKPGLRTIREMNLQCSAQNRVAVCSVACLAWTCGDRGVKRFRLWPQTRAILPLETLPAKEDRIGA